MSELDQEVERLQTALEADPELFTTHWPQVCEDITALARRRFRETVCLLDRLSSKAALVDSMALIEQNKEGKTQTELPDCSERVKKLQQDALTGAAREALQGMSYAELQARLTLIALENRQPCPEEWSELVRAVIPYDLEHALQLAQSCSGPTTPIAELVAAAWVRAPDPLFPLLRRLKASQGIYLWFEKLAADPDVPDGKRVIELLRILSECPAALQRKVLDVAQRLSEAERSQVLEALTPLLTKSVPMWQGTEASVQERVQLLAMLWRIDSARDRERRLRAIFSILSREIGSSRSIARQLQQILHDDAEGAQFVRAIRVHLALIRLCKVLQPLLIHRQAFAEYSKHWRRFLRAGPHIEALPESELRDELMAQFRATQLSIVRLYNDELSEMERIMG